jgi:hypothetical protein
MTDNEVMEHISVMPPKFWLGRWLTGYATYTSTNDVDSFGMQTLEWWWPLFLRTLKVFEK